MIKQKWTFKRALRHILAWSAYLFFNTAVYGHFQDDYLMVFLSHLKLLPLQIAISYLTIYYLIPKFVLEKQNYLLFFVLFLLSSVLIIIISNFFIYYSNPNYNFYDYYLISKYMINSYPVVGLVVAIKFWNYWHHNQLQQERLKKEKFETELKMLKLQIHPHFLFNTINNIYSLVLEKSNKAPGALLKLSEILNYVLYECNSDKVQLEKEILLLRNYLSLEKIRYEDRLDVLFNIEGPVNKVKIAPLMLLTFAENSFKHGIRKTINESWISFDIKVEENTVYIKIENSKNEELNSGTSHKNINKENVYLNGGIGLKNVKRRLDLIYSGRYELEVYNDKDSFLILLKINLIPAEIIH